MFIKGDRTINYFVLFQRKEKKKFPYHVRKNAEVDTADLQLYEQVERMPPFTRKTLVLVGPLGLPTNILIQRIVLHDPTLFQTVKLGKLMFCLLTCYLTID